MASMRSSSSFGRSSDVRSPPWKPGRVTPISSPSRFLPRRRAYSIPAMTRSRMRWYQRSALAPVIVNVALPIGVLVSRSSWLETKSMPTTYRWQPQLPIEGLKSRDRLHQLCGLHPECMSKSDDVEQADVAFAALDSPDIVSVQV